MKPLFKVNEVFLIPNGAIKVAKKLAYERSKEPLWDVVVGKKNQKVKLFRLSSREVIRLIQFNTAIENRLVMPWEDIDMNDYPGTKPTTTYTI